MICVKITKPGTNGISLIILIVNLFFYEDTEKKIVKQEKGIVHVAVEKHIINSKLLNLNV